MMQIKDEVINFIFIKSANLKLNVSAVYLFPQRIIQSKRKADNRKREVKEIVNENIKQNI
jgi:hypothetical protein